MGILGYNLFVMRPIIRKIDRSFKHSQYLLLMFPEDIVNGVVELKERVTAIAKRYGKV